jgi:hypothetical protein
MYAGCRCGCAWWKWPQIVCSILAHDTTVSGHFCTEYFIDIDGQGSSSGHIVSLYTCVALHCIMCYSPQGLAGFGTGFLSRFEGSQCPARLLEEITLIDTPGES